ncbi:MAG: acyl-CoA dehydrogenase C-terminal domain-containing protein, partial [Roseicyclus sp.]
IQAMDLVGRKMMDGGAAILALVDEVETEAKAAGDAGQSLAAAAAALRDTTQAVLALDLNDRFGGAASYLAGFARVLGAFYHLRAARAGDRVRQAMAGFYIARLLPEAQAAFVQARSGSAGLYDLSPEDLAA